VHTPSQQKQQIISLAQSHRQGAVAVFSQQLLL
jgi:hypothetical protein